MNADSKLEIPGFTTRYNTLPITSIQSFSNIRGGNNHGCKDVYFIRCIGNNASYIKEIQAMDRSLAERSQRQLGNYLRIKELPQSPDQNRIKTYSERFDLWLSSQRNDLEVGAVLPNPLLKQALNRAFCRIEEEFLRYSPQASESMARNFLIKIMFWTDHVSDSLLKEWNGKHADKFVFAGNIKKQEYLFCFFLTMLGIDVLLLLPEGEPALDTGLLAVSGKILMEKLEPCLIPSFCVVINDVKPVKNEVKAVVTSRPVLSVTAIASGRTTGKTQTVYGKREELEFEELARLATSVVMVTTLDDQGRLVGNGSGIMIGEKGYILTNNHVACGGASYSVRIEEEQQTYETDELIKWNSLLDLAIIRIDRRLKPIPIYKRNEPLVRGQKVVAIGSPLGLFNSVSNGIISGFREIGDVDMIQFTAPISHGSSGGALLNMHGEVIGISTAGYDSGQNINLAVDYRSIIRFVAGFES